MSKKVQVDGNLGCLVSGVWERRKGAHDVRWSKEEEGPEPSLGGRGEKNGTV